MEKLIKEARTYLGVPWIHQGRSRRGVDCVGFIVLAYKYIGVSIKEIKGYARNPDGIALKKVMDEQENFHEVEDFKVGDVVLFRIRHDPQHVALITPSNTFDFGMIHSYNGGKKMVVEHDFSDYWKDKKVSIYRLNEQWHS